MFNEPGVILGVSEFALFQEPWVLEFVKLLLLVVGVLYVVFAVIVMRQIGLMKKTLITPISPVLTILSIGHLIVAAGILVFFFGL